MEQLTQEEKEEILSSIDSEGFEYYFCDYTAKWRETPSEIQQLVENYVQAHKALKKVINKWSFDAE